MELDGEWELLLTVGIEPVMTWETKFKKALEHALATSQHLITTIAFEARRQ